MLGISKDRPEAQKKFREKLRLPFPLLSDASLALTRALSLPTFQVDGMTLLKRVTFVIDDGRITHIFYPVFPPDSNAAVVLNWLARVA